MSNTELNFPNSVICKFTFCKYYGWRMAVKESLAYLIFIATLWKTYSWYSCRCLWSHFNQEEETGIPEFLRFQSETIISTKTKKKSDYRKESQVFHLFCHFFLIIFSNKFRVLHTQHKFSFFLATCSTLCFFSEITKLYTMKYAKKTTVSVLLT